MSVGNLQASASASDTQLTFTVPDSGVLTSTSSGPYRVTVTVDYVGPADRDAVSAESPNNDPVDDLYVASGPTVTQVVPGSITATSSPQTITVNGTGFYGGSASSNVSGVTIGGTAAVSYQVLSDAQLTAIVPASKTSVVNVYDVVVTTTGGTSATSPADALTVVAATPVSNPTPVSSAGSPAANPATVSVSFNTATHITLTGSDPNSPVEALTYTLLTLPLHGNLSGTAPNLTYNPTAGYNGLDSFSFKVENTSDLFSAPAAVALNVSPGAPTANAQSAAVAFNTAKPLTLVMARPKLPARYSHSPIPWFLSRLWRAAGTLPNLSYTPTTGYNGKDSFTFTAENTSGVTKLFSYRDMTVAAGTPTANGQSVEVPFNAPTQVTLTGTDPNSPVGP